MQLLLADDDERCEEEEACNDEEEEACSEDDEGAEEEEEACSEDDEGAEEEEEACSEDDEGAEEEEEACSEDDEGTEEEEEACNEDDEDIDEEEASSSIDDDESSSSDLEEQPSKKNSTTKKRNASFFIIGIIYYIIFVAKQFYRDNTKESGSKMPTKVFDIPGPKKAAILMVALGQEASAHVFKSLGEKDVETLTAQIARLEGVTPEMREYVLQEFKQISSAQEYVSQGGLEFAQQILEQSLGSRRAREILEKVQSNIRTTGFNMLDSVDPVQLVSFLSKERPQTVALLLAHMKPENAAATISALNPYMQVEVATRIATMESISPEVLQQVEQQLSQILKTMFTGGTAEVGGIKSVAEMLNMVDRGTEKNILGTLERDDIELATKIKALMFVFEDMLLLDDKSMQTVLKQVDTKDLSLALKGANEQVAEKFYTNMSNRAAEMIKEEILYMGPKRLREVEEAQQKIVDVVRRLEAENEIVISGRGSEDDIIV